MPIHAVLVGDSKFQSGGRNGIEEVFQGAWGGRRDQRVGAAGRLDGNPRSGAYRRERFEYERGADDYRDDACVGPTGICCSTPTQSTATKWVLASYYPATIQIAGRAPHRNRLAYLLIFDDPGAMGGCAPPIILSPPGNAEASARASRPARRVTSRRPAAPAGRNGTTPSPGPASRRGRHDGRARRD